ncbi:hypothetical protein LADH09A_004674 [Micromonospora sp. LAH09]|uniref:hypothetical protein n=1 Tax=Micromonospora cabrerizensis TaxID=2911213 RepID=UPI001EE82D2A|nr:hypothetical protein [Micromonospora cabrerizensis]MCG5470703.1 hypothetical protein [Micromonospora cabrerizensis]
MSDGAGDSYTARVSAYRQELAGMRAGPPRTDAVAQGRADGAHGSVAVVAARGRLQSVEVAAPLLRMSGAELSPLVTQASNTALAETRALSSDVEQAPDIARLTDGVVAVLAESELAMHRLQGALAEAVAKVGPATGLGGELPAQGPAELLHGVLDVLRSASATTPGPDQVEEGERRWTGSDDAGQVLAEVDVTGQVVRLELVPRAGRFTSVELGESIVEAVNRALDEIEPADAPQHGPSWEDLGGRAAELQEASIRQMAALTGALTGMMARVREP